MKKLFVLTVLTTALCMGQAHSADGNGVKGGDLLSSRQELIRKFIINDLKIAVLQYVGQLSDSFDQEAVGLRLLRSLAKAGLNGDISQSPYNPEMGHCYENGVRKTASTAYDPKKFTLGAVICMDPELLAKEGATKREIVGLALHEHAHHFSVGESKAREIEIYVSARYKEGEDQSRWSCSAYCYVEANLFRGFWKGSETFRNQTFIAKNGDTPDQALSKVSRACDSALEVFKKRYGEKERYNSLLSTAGSSWGSLDSGSMLPNINNACRPITNESHFYLNK